MISENSTLVMGNNISGLNDIPNKNDWISAVTSYFIGSNHVPHSIMAIRSDRLFKKRNALGTKLHGTYRRLTQGEIQHIFRSDNQKVYGKMPDGSTSALRYDSYLEIDQEMSLDIVHIVKKMLEDAGAGSRRKRETLKIIQRLTGEIKSIHILAYKTEYLANATLGLDITLEIGRSSGVFLFHKITKSGSGLNSTPRLVGIDFEDCPSPKTIPVSKIYFTGSRRVTSASISNFNIDALLDIDGYVPILRNASTYEMLTDLSMRVYKDKNFLEVV